MTRSTKLALALLLSTLLPLAAQTVPAPHPLSVVVFSDFECPYSAHFFFVLQQYERSNPGKLHVTFKQSPLPIHPGAPLAARAALAAGHQGRYDAMAELLYANQKHLDRDSLLADARQLHLDMVRFRRDLDSPAIAAELAADMDEARAFGITQTPTSYIEGKTVVGEQTNESLVAAIQAIDAPVQSASAQAAAAVAQPPAPALDPGVIAALALAPSAEQGAANAPLTIVEFTDFQCPYCKAAVAPMEQFLLAHGRQVRWVVHSFPLDFHPDSELANEAALAAGEQGKFWPMHDLLFAHQDALKLPDLRRYAEELHLDVQAFNDALATHRLAGKIAADRTLGMKAGVDGTPTFFVDGHAFSGAPSVTELDQLLAEHQTPVDQREVVVAAAALPTVVDRRVLGTDAAPLTLTWYTDVRSPLAPAQVELVRALAEHYAGKIRVNFKAYPLAAHADSRLASAALLAACDQNRFWPMYDALAAHSAPLDRAAVLNIATVLKLDAATFAASLDAASGTLQDSIDEAQRRGILGAPVIFLNGQRVDGLQREGFYTAIADQELKSAPGTQANLTAPLKPAP
jgi:protein-disulfide isomerase